MADVVKLSLMDDGPILIEGNFKLQTADGKDVLVEGNKAALCRCGASSNKPFCDGTHRKVGFKSSNSEEETK